MIDDDGIPASLKVSRTSSSAFQYVWNPVHPCTSSTASSTDYNYTLTTSNKYWPPDYWSFDHPGHFVSIDRAIELSDCPRKREEDQEKPMSLEEVLMMGSGKS